MSVGMVVIAFGGGDAMTAIWGEGLGVPNCDRIPSLTGLVIADRRSGATDDINMTLGIGRAK